MLGEECSREPCYVLGTWFRELHVGTRLRLLIGGAGGSLVISTSLIYFLTTNVHIWYLASSWVASGVSGASNFFAHRYWTYSTKKLPLNCQQSTWRYRLVGDDTFPSVGNGYY